MKIIRNNETIKLTPEELLLAYEEQQLLFYMQDIRKRAEHLGISDALSDESCLAIAERFVPDADSNTSLYGQIDNEIKEYVEEHELFLWIEM